MRAICKQICRFNYAMKRTSGTSQLDKCVIAAQQMHHDAAQWQQKLNEPFSNWYDWSVFKSHNCTHAHMHDKSFILWFFFSCFTQNENKIHTRIYIVINEFRRSKNGIRLSKQQDQQRKLFNKHSGKQRISSEFTSNWVWIESLNSVCSAIEMHNKAANYCSWIAVFSLFIFRLLLRLVVRLLGLLISFLGAIIVWVCFFLFLRLTV